MVRKHRSQSPYELANPYLTKLGDRSKRTVTKEAWAKFAPKYARPLHVAPLQARKVEGREQCAAGPGALCKGDACNSPLGVHTIPSFPADPRETRRKLSFSMH